MSKQFPCIFNLIQDKVFLANSLDRTQFAEKLLRAFYRSFIILMQCRNEILKKPKQDSQQLLQPLVSVRFREATTFKITSNRKSDRLNQPSYQEQLEKSQTIEENMYLKASENYQGKERGRNKDDKDTAQGRRNYMHEKLFCF